MAVELESYIMRQIGLGQHYSYFNSSGSCEYIRKEAARRLPGAIEKAHNEGKEIASSNASLCNLVSRIAEQAEESKYELTKTWEAASDIIQAHLSLFYAQTPQEQQEIIDNITKFINEHYLPYHARSKQRYGKYTQWDTWGEESYDEYEWNFDK